MAGWEQPGCPGISPAWDVHPGGMYVHTASDMTVPPVPAIHHGFNPNDRRYKSCCCHTKTFTVAAGIVEIFTICFILVAVLPDVNSRMCDSHDHLNVTHIVDESFRENASENYKTAIRTAKQIVCDLSLLWLGWSIAQIVAVNLMFYGIKNIQWPWFIPHIFFRLSTIGIFFASLALELFSVFEGGENASPCVVATVFTGLICLLLLYATLMELRCAHFIKRSQETGYSLSVARPIGPATISLSERDQPQQGNTIRILPPLRHTYGGRDPAKQYAEESK